MTIDSEPRRNAAAVLPVLAAAAFGTAWFALTALRQQRGLPGSSLVMWLLPPVALALSVWTLRRTATLPGLPPAARRFWNHIVITVALAAVGLLVEAAFVLATADRLQAQVRTEVYVVSAPFFIAVVVFVVWALLRVPAGPRTPGEWVRLWLDSATVAFGAAIFMCYLAYNLPLSRGGGYALWAPLAVGAVCLVGVFAVVKIVLAGPGPVDTGALRLLGAALVIGCVSASSETLSSAASHVMPAQVCVPLISVALVLAGERQRRALLEDLPAVLPPRRNSLSLLPFAAVGATQVLLVLATIGPVQSLRYLAVGGAAVVTALVTVRQVVAFADNARLVDRLRQQEDRLRHQASHDTLTQLSNRALFVERLDDALRAGSESNGDGELTALLIDLDDFKTVNDTLGHSVGDRLLTAVAERIRRCVRPDATVARLGGDEFAVLLRSDGRGVADGIAGRLLSSLKRPLVVDGCELLVRASIGVAVARSGDNAEALLRNADIAMYAAKERCKGSFSRYVPGMAAGILEHAQLGAQLRQALEREQLHLLYQPVVRLSDRRIIGMEALVRWRHPVRGLLAPADFVPIAERTGLIAPLGRWVLREACRQKAVWRDTHGDLSPATVGVNVSGRQLQEPGFADEVAAVVREYALKPHNLVIEVTETAVLAGGQVLDTVKALYDFGVSVALDDFGTGHSSLGAIRTCPVRILKLDKSFVLDGGSGAHAQQQAAVATAVAHIAEALGLDAVAEGIECPEQAERLWELGYRLGQGFHLGPPMPVEEMDKVLALDSVRT
jgi:diguanylate cyclase (GGDEF)-like protein